MFKRLTAAVSKVAIRFADRVQVYPSPPFVCFCSLAPKIRGEEADKVAGLLKKGDVILSRWDRYVTSRAVPGFWSHCGIASGKKKVIHAALDGVIEDHVLDFLRTDWVMILRMGGDDAEDARRKAVAVARDARGREYDYLFDGCDPKAVYCFELVRMAYPVVPEKMRILAKDIIDAPGFEPVFDSREWRKER